MVQQTSQLRARLDSCQELFLLLSELISRQAVLVEKLLQTGNLDTGTGAEIIEILAALAAERGTTIIVATHDTGLAGRAPRRLAMRDGRFVASDADTLAGSLVEA